MRTGLLLAITVLLVPCYAFGTQSVSLINPSLETAVTNYAYPSVINVTTTVGIGWFSDYATTYAKGGVIADGTAATPFWKMNGAHGQKAGFATQVGPDSGASLFQTVWLDAGNTYTLTSAVCTGTRVGYTTYKNDAKWALIFSPYPVEGIQTHGLVETTGTMVQSYGTFVDYSVSYAPTTSGYYNIGLQNRGYVPGTGDNTSTSTVFFDNVRLTYTPEPTTALLLIGCSLFGLLRRRSA